MEITYLRVSQAPFFFLCLAIMLVWLVSLPLWVDLKAWQVAIHTVTSVISLHLLDLLENAGRRAEEAAQERQWAWRNGTEGPKISRVRSAHRCG